MGTETFEQKVAWLQEQGIQADDRVESLTAELHRMEGLFKAFSTAEQKIGSEVFARFKKDIDEGKVPADPNEAVDKYLQTCIHFMKHLATQAQTQVPIMRGRVQEAQETVNRLKSLQNLEKLKVQAVQTVVSAGVAHVNENGEAEMAPTNGHANARPVGVHPGMSLKAQRQAEEAHEVIPEPAAPKVRKKRGKNS